MAYEILELIQNYKQVEVRKEVVKPKEEKRVRIKEIIAKGKINGEIRGEIIELKDTVENWIGEIEALNYAPYDGKLNRMQYAYYYLINSKQVVKDYFPKYIQKKLLPKLEEDIAVLKLRINKFILMTKGEERREEIFYNILKEYLSEKNEGKKKIKIGEVKEVYLPLKKFQISLDREMLKIQAKEEKYFGKEVEPMSPKRKVMVYLIDIEKLLGKETNIIDLKQLKEIVLNYVEGKPLRVTEEEDYNYYIEMLRENKVF
jgi:metal-responsive CopG/Arc/MetJ family transcriptional regulator